MTLRDKDCNTCRHHVQAGKIPATCQTCLEITCATFGEGTRLPFYEPKEAPLPSYRWGPVIEEIEMCNPPEYQGVQPAVDRAIFNEAMEKSFLEPGGVVVAGPAPSVVVFRGTKKDTNPKDAVGVRKAPLSVVPMNVVAEAGVAMLEGALKYGRHNYRDAGIRESVYFDGTMRHLIAYWEGEDIDPDSGVSHLTKAIASLLVWRDAQLNGNATDDRPPKSRPFYPDLNQRAAGLIDSAATKPSPKHFTEKGTT